jgi:hypothetical protein
MADIQQPQRETIDARPAWRPTLLWDITPAAAVCRLRAGTEPRPTKTICIAEMAI